MIVDNSLTTTSIMKLFETTKAERESFCMDIVNRIDSGYANPLEVHLQVKCMESIIKSLNENSNYKAAILDAAQKQGAKSFEFHNAKFEQKEVGTKYDFTSCGDTEWEQLDAQLTALKEQIKQRETFLKTVSPKGLAILNEATGELTTVYPPAKSSTTSIVVTLK